MKKIIIALSGPSCVGKTPLLDAVEKYYPELKFHRPVVYMSREPRPLEIDGVHYHFRTQEYIRNLPTVQYVIAKTRQNWQGVDTIDILHNSLPTVIDAHPTLVEALMRHANLGADKAIWIRVFLQPNTMEEIEQVRLDMQSSMQQAVAAMRTPHLITRALKQGKELLPPVLSDINVRVNAAWQEILVGQSFDHIIINHDGEDSGNWLQQPPSGEAGATLVKFAQILQHSINKA